MENNSENFLAGGIILMGIIIVLISIIGAVLSMFSNQFIGAGLLLIAASLPVCIAIHWVFKD